MNSVYRTDFKNLDLKHRGKVRDIYDLGSYLLFIASDRISAFDVIMDQPVPGKGQILSKISAFWFEKTKHIIDNHLVTNDVKSYPAECAPYAAELEGRSMLVKKCQPLPVEAIVRGYITGSGWKEYKSKGSVCNIPLKPGLVEFEKLPEPIFTPTTKAEVGHDENIDYDGMGSMIGSDLAEQVKKVSIDLYNFAWSHLEQRGIIVADTKFEFGIYEDKLILIDEVLTPDSSRFWLKEKYAPGHSQYNFDKQVLRDYLESLNWNKMPPPPALPDDILELTSSKYDEAYRRIVLGEN